MNLKKLFETQQVLRERIAYNGPDRFSKLVLALLVELGECANEHRSFKFWSTDQEPRTKKARQPYVDLEDAEFYNPMLEEYVDALHFVLELGIEKDYTPSTLNIWLVSEENITDSFLSVYEAVLEFELYSSPDNYDVLLFRFFELGLFLGFNWEQIEQAYYSKNQINHQRQDQGY
ncbi:hypothetical protein GJU40_01615 [Bacillus lacus]|uniref:dUTPase n=1 Tax=Metabacillus lacus TaxID=1983721 RepID=A0A7X2LYQ3_9BACI|nr:dUTP diphosphatase [Metabacillus lacus]MRX70864.1 hypothetical protein [Metabacillus lacus]